jgi:hypothetical protein
MVTAAGQSRPCTHSISDLAEEAGGWVERQQEGFQRKRSSTKDSPTTPVVGRGESGGGVSADMSSDVGWRRAGLELAGGQAAHT